MKTILYLRSSLNASNNSDLEGVGRYAKTAGWRIHVTPYADAAFIRGGLADRDRRPDVKGLLELWKPDGCKFHLFRRRPFGDDAETYRAWLREWLRKAPKPMGGVCRQRLCGRNRSFLRGT